MSLADAAQRNASMYCYKLFFCILRYRQFENEHFLKGGNSRPFRLLRLLSKGIRFWRQVPIGLGRHLQHAVGHLWLRLHGLRTHLLRLRLGRTLHGLLRHAHHWTHLRLWLLWLRLHHIHGHVHWRLHLVDGSGAVHHGDSWSSVDIAIHHVIGAIHHVVGAIHHVISCAVLPKICALSPPAKRSSWMQRKFADAAAGLHHCF